MQLCMYQISAGSNVVLSDEFFNILHSYFLNFLLHKFLGLLLFTKIFPYQNFPVVLNT